uniref:Uncharacterized protein AlNc14C273G10002 n=1 Tax=Albugo laibachii Nc14 TaxID=890382 RepID=F0WUJ1_9STRA|nr:conserved hypothetical protein [Albugo laibachii Nc14]|eukprot:CCA25072.1 conserved hypothetical protein [Albugo laibachii Nc14]
MGQAPELGVHGQRLPEYHYPGRGIQYPGFVHPGRQTEEVPDSQQRRLAPQPFDGKEIYHGLGSEFLEWGKEFVRQISYPERACGFSWPEDINVDVLGQHLAGRAQKYYRRQVECWWSEKQTLEHAMQRLLQAFSTKITPAQSMKLFTAPKALHRSWIDHILYLTDSTEIEARTKHFVRDVVNAVDPRNIFKSKEKIDHPSLKKCYRCGKEAHLKATCPYRKKHVQQEDFTLAIGATSIFHWILDSGSSRHLVNDLNLLEDPVDFNSEFLTAASDGEPFRITKKGSLMITVKALGVRKTVRLLDVQYAENLERNIISYG